MNSGGWGGGGGPRKPPGNVLSTRVGGINEDSPPWRRVDNFWNYTFRIEFNTAYQPTRKRPGYPEWCVSSWSYFMIRAERVLGAPVAPKPWSCCIIMFERVELGAAVVPWSWCCCMIRVKRVELGAPVVPQPWSYFMIRVERVELGGPVVPQPWSYFMIRVKRVELGAPVAPIKLAECTASSIDQFFTWKPTFFGPNPTFPSSPHAMLFVRKGSPTSRLTLHRGGGEGGTERILQQFGKKALCPTHFGQDCRWSCSPTALKLFYD